METWNRHAVISYKKKGTPRCTGRTRQHIFDRNKAFPEYSSVLIVIYSMAKLSGTKAHLPNVRTKSAFFSPSPLHLRVRQNKSV